MVSLLLREEERETRDGASKVRWAGGTWGLVGRIKKPMIHYRPTYQYSAINRPCLSRCRQIDRPTLYVYFTFLHLVSYLTINQQFGREAVKSHSDQRQVIPQRGGLGGLVTSSTVASWKREVLPAGRKKVPPFFRSTIFHSNDDEKSLT
jgi:hypothetical protein